MYNIINHIRGQRYRAGTMVRWSNNTIAVVQSDGRHIIVANLNKIKYKNSSKLEKLVGGTRKVNSQLRIDQEFWEKEWDTEIQKQRKRQNEK